MIMNGHTQCLNLFILFLNCYSWGKRDSVPCRSKLTNCSMISPGNFDCSSRMFQNIPCFPNGTTSVDLSRNLIHVFGRSLAGLRRLRSLNLANNSIDSIEDGALADLISLEVLDISNNNLSQASFPVRIFASLHNIEELRLQNNAYNGYPKDVFADLLSVTALHIDVFQDFEFNEDFLSLTQLSRVEFYPQSRFSLHNGSFCGLSNSPILYLNLQFSNWIHLPIGVNVLSPFRYLRGIKINIRLSGDIKDALSMLYGLRGLNMEYIDLSDNLKTVTFPIHLRRSDLISLQEICVRKVSLTNNDIEIFPFETFFGTPFWRCLETFHIAENSIHSGNFIPLIQFLFYPNIKDIDMSDMGQGEKINGPKKGVLTGHIADHVKFSLNRLNLTIHVSDSLREIKASNIYLYTRHTPPEIHFTFEAHGLHYVDFSYTSINTLCGPGFTMTYITDIKYLDISDWSCSEMNPTFLSSIQTLETLIFRNAMLDRGLQNDKDGAFLRGMNDLGSVDLSGNNMQKLHRRLFIDQRNTLKHLTLDDNGFDHIPVCISNLQNLKVLSLKNNRISSISSTDMKILQTLGRTNFSLSGNRFICECTAIESLKWIGQNAHKVVDFRTLKCTDNSLVSDITDTMLQFELHCISTYWLKFAITLLVLTACLVVGGVLAFKYRVTIEYFYLRLRMFVHHYKPLSRSDGYTFDAFLSYSHHDKDWVINVLYKHMTENLEQNVSVHDKDFQVGHWISDEIIRCIDESRHVVFVITSHFLESDWSTYEMEMARMHAFRAGRTGLIIIMKESIPLQEMPDILKKIWWRVVCLEWPNDENSESEALFWDKLRLAVNL